ncbi:hypothetical protein B0H21DRAFT_183344 [Amylocystis lapponica]|nr:hypothetical protein B0H21DRAFT_183344 [Amylocystis lapponica]
MSELPILHRIDVHHHWFPASLKKADQSVSVGWRTPPENLPWTPWVSLRAMDALGIDLAVLSLPAGVPGGAVGMQNRRAAREFNVHASRICLEHPGRFGFFACLPIPSDSQAALEELAFALDTLGAEGIALASSYGEGSSATYIGHDEYDPVWEELDKRGAVVFLHGAQTPSSTPYPHPFLGIPITEVPNETFKAAAHLVVTGKRRRFPNVKIVLAHLGGCTAALAPRVAVLSQHMGCTLTPEEILEDFASFYYETALSAHETTLAAAETFVKPGRLLLGTDFPAVSKDMADWYTKKVDEFYVDEPDKLAHVTYKNAMKLLPNLKKRLDW